MSHVLISPTSLRRCHKYGRSSNGLLVTCPASAKVCYASSSAFPRRLYHPHASADEYTYTSLCGLCRFKVPPKHTKEFAQARLALHRHVLSER